MFYSLISLEQGVLLNDGDLYRKKYYGKILNSFILFDNIFYYSNNKV